MLILENLTLNWKPRSFLFHKNNKDKTIPPIWIVLQLIQDYSWHVNVKFTKLCLIPLTSAPQVHLCRPVGIKARNTRNSLWRASLELSAIRSNSQIMVSTHPKNTKTSPPNPFLHLEFCSGPPVPFCYPADPTVHILSPTLALGCARGCPRSEPRLYSSSQNPSRRESICFTEGILSSGSNWIDFTALEK